VCLFFARSLCFGGPVLVVCFGVCGSLVGLLWLFRGGSKGDTEMVLAVVLVVVLVLVMGVLSLVPRHFWGDWC